MQIYLREHRQKTFVMLKRFWPMRGVGKGRVVGFPTSAEKIGGSSKFDGGGGGLKSKHEGSMGET